MFRTAFHDNPARKTQTLSGTWYTSWQVTTLMGTIANDKGKRKYHYHVTLGTIGYSLILCGY